MRSLGLMTERDRECHDLTLSRLESNTFVRLLLLLSPGDRLKPQRGLKCT